MNMKKICPQCIKQHCLGWCNVGSEITNYVTGETKYTSCYDKNTHGDCNDFVPAPGYALACAMQEALMIKPASDPKTTEGT